MNKKRSFLRTAAAYPHMLWSLLFIVVPLLFVLYYALTVENPDGSFSFSFSNITALGSESYFPVFIRSICFAVVATLICLLLAYPLAYTLSQCKVSSQRMLIMLVMLPMWMNLLIRTYSWMNILETNGVINNFLASIGLPRMQLLGNAVGCVVFGTLVRFGLPALAAKAELLSAAKLGETAPEALIRSFFCGVLMYVAVWIFRNKKTVLGIFICIPVFILSGFEHSVANMFYFATGAAYSLEALLYTLIFILGNSLGAWVIPALMLAVEKSEEGKEEGRGKSEEK